MMARSRELDAFTHQSFEIEIHVMAFAPFVAAFASCQNLIDRAQQTIRVREHQSEKLLALRFAHIAALHGLKVEPDGRDGRFQFVGDGVDETVVLFVAANLAHQENGVQDHSGDDGEEENHSEKKKNTFTAVEDNPADIESDRQGHYGAAQNNEERDGFPSTCDFCYGGLIGLYREAGWRRAGLRMRELPELRPVVVSMGLGRG